MLQTILFYTIVLVKGIHCLSDPLRSRQQSGIRSARGLFGETPVRDQGFEGAGAGRGSPLQYRPSPPCLSREGEKDGGERATGHSAVLRKSWPGRWGLPRLNFPIRGVPKSSLGGKSMAPGPLPCSVIAQRQPGLLSLGVGGQLRLSVRKLSSSHWQALCSQLSRGPGGPHGVSAAPLNH